jgi:hypothetical protein
MKRWSAGLLLAFAVVVAGYLLWPRLFPFAANVKHFDGKSTEKILVPADPIKDAIVELQDEYFRHQSSKPSPAARQKIRELAALGPKANEIVYVLDDWLGQMFCERMTSSVEFRELAQALLAVEPTAPQRIVTAHYNAPFDKDLEYAAQLLMAFGPVAIPEILEGLRNEAEHAERVKYPEKSRLPNVLAQMGPDALPAIKTALCDELPYVRGQAVRSLTLMGADKAGPILPELAKVLDDSKKGDVHLAILRLLKDFGPRATEVLPSIRRLAGEDQPPEVREAARKLLNQWDGSE